MSCRYVLPDRARRDPTLAILHGLDPHGANGIRVVHERCQLACLGFVGRKWHVPNWGQDIDHLGGLDLSIGVGRGQVPAFLDIVGERPIPGCAVQAPLLDLEQRAPDLDEGAETVLDDMLELFEPCWIDWDQ
jgi:hypothetical protein